MAGHRVVEVPTSKMKREITKILFEQGYILNYKFDDTNAPKGTIKIALKYDPVDKVNAATFTESPVRVSASTPATKTCPVSSTDSVSPSSPPPRAL